MQSSDIVLSESCAGLEVGVERGRPDQQKYEFEPEGKEKLGNSSVRIYQQKYLLAPPNIEIASNAVTGDIGQEDGPQASDVCVNVSQNDFLFN